MALELEGTNMPEIVAALEVAEREIIRLDDEVSRLRRMKPKRHVVMLCGVDCYPNDAVCNNYCNLAPEKGPMAARPPPGPDAPQPTAAGEQT